RTGDGTGIEAEEEVGVSAELHCVGGNGEVSVGVDTREGFIDDVERDPLGCRKRQRWRVELRMKTTDGQYKIGIISVGKENAHRAGDGNKQDVRVEQLGEEVEALFVKFQYANEINLQHQDRHIVRRQGGTQDTENGGIARWDLDDDAQREAN